MTQEELRQELLEDDRYERDMRADYDFFIEQVLSSMDAETIRKEFRKVEGLCEKYGWQFDECQLLNEIL